MIMFVSVFVSVFKGIECLGFWRLLESFMFVVMLVKVGKIMVKMEKKFSVIIGGICFVCVGGFFGAVFSFGKLGLVGVEFIVVLSWKGSVVELIVGCIGLACIFW